MSEPTINIGTGLTWRMCAYVCIVALVLGIGLGAWGMHVWTVSDLREQLAGLAAQLQAEKNKPVQVKETVRTETQTQLAYIPRETIKYIDAKTGQEVTKPLDGQFELGKTEFTYTVNGRPGTFTKTDDEKYVFDKNMLKLNQSSSVTLTVDVPTIDKTRRNAIGPYVTTESYGLLASRDTDRQRVLIMAGKKWDEKNGRGFEAGGAWQMKF